MNGWVGLRTPRKKNKKKFKANGMGGTSLEGNREHFMITYKYIQFFDFEIVALPNCFSLPKARNEQKLLFHNHLCFVSPLKKYILIIACAQYFFTPKL